MNGMKNPFSTLIRMGKKKDSSLSKSTSNLNQSMTTYDNSITSSHTNLNNSQLGNRIVPLSNMRDAPFEQTFRITVCLPRDQLYVVRLGAKTQLLLLLKMVCDDKQLDFNKYALGHPTDPSQVFSNELTIGQVGLNELRLIQKSAINKMSTAQNNHFNSDEIYRLRNDSRHKSSSLTSPYSSTNSLNSIDSSGMSSSMSSSRGHQPVAPLRKKRAAPRPPSQNSIPENRLVVTPMVNNIINNKNNHVYNNKDVNYNNNKDRDDFKEPYPVMPRKNFHVSSPNLMVGNTNGHNHSITNNNNHTNNNNNINNNNHNQNNNNNISLKSQEIFDDYGETNNGGGSETDRYSSVNELNRIEERAKLDSRNHRPMSMHVLNQQRSEIDSYHSGSMQDINHSRTSSDSSELREGGPEPAPRRRIFSGAKKKAPPAPQPRGNTTTVNGLPPVPQPRKIETPISVETIDHDEKLSDRIDANGSHMEDTVSLKSTGSSLNGDHQIITTKESPAITPSSTPSPAPSNHSSVNVSKVMLNVDVLTPPPSTAISSSPSSLSTLSSIDDSHHHHHRSTPSPPVSETHTTQTRPDDEDKIEPTTIHRSPPSSPTCSSSVSISIKARSSDADVSSVISSEGSSELDDSKIKVYNLSSGKSVTAINTSSSNQLTPPPSPKMVVTPDVSPEKEIVPVAKNVEVNIENPTPSPTRSGSPLWTYTLPAPPEFGDKTEAVSNGVANGGGGGGGNVTTTVGDQYFNDYMSSADNHTILSDSNTTIISDVDIQPVIKERMPIVENDLYNDKLTLIDDRTSNATSDRQSDDAHLTISSSEDIINSDIEDGYHGGSNLSREEMLMSLEKRREKMIENEFEFLIKEEEKDATRDAVMYTTTKSTKIDVIEELNTVIKDNRIETLIRRSSHEQNNDQFEEINRTTMSNFTIAAYTSDNERKSSTISTTSSTSSTDDKAVFKKPFIQNKRRSLTLTNNIFPTSKTVINRSDSFHSTRVDSLKDDAITTTTTNGIVKSSSYMSLLGDTTFSRRRSSSELSIHESPSLQSLEVMKKIMPGLTPRKSLEEKEPVHPMVTEKVEKKMITKIDTIIQPPIVEKAIVVEKTKPIDIEEKIIVVEEKTVKVIAKPNSMDDKKVEVSSKSEDSSSEKRYKYQGPPAINFSSWSERPKIQVAIKSDRDYKFGGSAASSNKLSSSDDDEQPIIEKRPLFIDDSVPKTQQNGFERPRLPIVRSVEYKKSVVVPHQHDEPAAVITMHKPQPQATSTTILASQQPQPQKEFSAPSVVLRNQNVDKTTNFYSKFSRPNTVNVVGFQSTPNHMVSSPPITTQTFLQKSSNTMNTKYTPVVRGFKIEPTKQAGEDQVDHPVIMRDNRPNPPKKPSFRYSSHETAVSPSSTPQQQLPFGQNTLRRTGYKDKILAKENNVNTTNVVANEPTKPTIIAPTTVDPKPSIIPQQNGNTVTNGSQAPPPPPPIKQAPIVRAVVVKKSMSTIEVDPRDQLLNAIRDFNRDKLNKKR